jgi:hypothetical protein
VSSGSGLAAPERSGGGSREAYGVRRIPALSPFRGHLAPPPLALFTPVKSVSIRVHHWLEFVFIRSLALWLRLCRSFAAFAAFA